MNFSDKVVLITGAGSGIGRALALGLLEAGAKVVLVGRRRDKLESVLAASPRGAAGLAVPTDVSQTLELQALLQAVQAHYGRLDALVNNAGIAYGGTILDITPDEMEQLMQVNLIAPIRLTQMAFPLLMAQPEALVCNVSSLAGLIALPHQSVYCASKHGLSGFGAALRRECAGTPIRVVTVHPGLVDTEMSTGFADKLNQLGITASLMKASDVAERILRDIGRGKDQIVIGGRDKAMLTMSRWTPRLFDRKVSRMGPTFLEVMRLPNERTRQRNRIH